MSLLQSERKEFQHQTDQSNRCPAKGITFKRQKYFDHHGKSGLEKKKVP